MTDKLRAHVNQLFTDAPQSRRTVELKEEMIQNLTDQYNDLMAEGKSPEAAYNITVAGIGDVSELISGLNGGDDVVQREIVLKREQQRALRTAIAIALYVLCVIPCILIGNTVGVCLMFVLAAIATGLLVYNGIDRRSVRKVTGDNVVEDFKAWSEEKGGRNQALDSILKAVWALTIALYIIVSFLTGAWHITWVMFVLCVAVNAIIRAFFDLKK